MAYIGFYIPGDRRDDYTGEVTDPFTGEVSRPPSMTKQEFVKSCDINNIIKEYTITGQINHVAAKAAQGAFVDLPDAPDFQESMNTVIRAQEAFAALPSGIRNRFENDPAQFLDFCSNPENAQDLIDMGLATALAPPPTATASAPPPTGGDGGTPPSEGSGATVAS